MEIERHAYDHDNKSKANFHEEEKSFKCKFCNTGYKQKTGLALHVAMIHDGKKVFKCEICGFSFLQKAFLSRHIATTTKKRSHTNVVFVIPVSQTIMK